MVIFRTSTGALQRLYNFSVTLGQNWSVTIVGYSLTWNKQEVICIITRGCTEILSGFTIYIFNIKRQKKRQKVQNGFQYICLISWTSSITSFRTYIYAALETLPVQQDERDVLTVRSHYFGVRDTSHVHLVHLALLVSVCKQWQLQAAISYCIRGVINPMHCIK